VFRESDFWLGTKFGVNKKGEVKEPWGSNIGRPGGDSFRKIPQRNDMLIFFKRRECNRPILGKGLKAAMKGCELKTKMSTLPIEIVGKNS